MKLKKLLLFYMVVILFICFPYFTNADDSLDKQEKALKIIADFADKICTSVPLSGKSKNLELTGDAKAELKGLAKKVAELGIGSAVNFTKNEYQGVLQKDLPEMLKSNIDCKKEVSTNLIDKLLRPSAPPQIQKSTPNDTLKIKNNQSLNPLAYDYSINKEISEYSYKIYPPSQHKYSLFVKMKAKFKNNQFNTFQYLNSLRNIKFLEPEILSQEFSERLYNDYLNSKRNKQLPNISEMQWGLYFKFKNKPKPTDKFSVMIGPITKEVTIGSLKWKKYNNEGQEWWGGYAELDLDLEDPDWVILHSSRLLKLVNANGETSSGGLIEVILENRSAVTYAVSDLSIYAEHFKGYACSVGPGATPNEWIQVTLNWDRIVSGANSNSSSPGWVRLEKNKGVKSSIVTFA